VFGSNYAKGFLTGAVGAAVLLTLRAKASTPAAPGYGERAPLSGIGAQHVTLLGLGVAAGLAVPMVEEKISAWKLARRVKKLEAIRVSSAAWPKPEVLPVALGVPIDGSPLDGFSADVFVQHWLNRDSAVPNTAPAAASPTTSPNAAPGAADILRLA